MSEELCLLALVDDDIEDQVREKMASKLLKIPKPDSFSMIGCPTTRSLENVKDASDLVGPNS